MYLIYIDESEDDHNFVLAGLGVVDAQALSVAGDVDDIERTYFEALPDSERPVLFHCTVMRNPASYLARKKPKREDRELALLVVTWDEERRNELVRDVYRVIQRRPRLDLVLFGVVIDKQVKETPSIREADLSSLRYDRAFEELYATVNAYLMRHHQGRVDTSQGLTRYGTQKGILPMDRSANAQTIKAQAAVYRRKGTRYGGAGFNVVETPVFLPSMDSRMLQLTDFCANAILRRFRPPPQQDAAAFNDVLLDKFDREGQDRHGLLHVISADCYCPARHYRSLVPS